MTLEKYHVHKWKKQTIKNEQIDCECYFCIECKKITFELPMQETKQKEIRDWEEKFKNEFGIHFSESEFKFAIDFISTLLAERDAEVREYYDELIMAVGNKYPNETRHETALRYIKQAEQGSREAIERPIEEYCICDDLSNIPHKHNDGRIIKLFNKLDGK